MLVTDVVAAINSARRDGARLALRGLGTSGTRPGHTARVLEMSLLTGELQLDTDNLSVSVPAGYPLARLAGELAERGLCYPPAADLAPTGTVGGHLAAATGGPWRLGRGTARDWVLGLEAVTGEGSVVSTGSRVVKNVAGLDLSKLLVGSRGRLAAITRAHLRLAPLPDRRATCGARFSRPGDALAALPGLLATPLAPTAVELIGSVLAVGLEGTDADLPRRLAQAADCLKAAGGVPLAEPPSLTLTPLPLGSAGVLLRAGLPPGRARPWVEALPEGVAVHGHAGSGLYNAVLPPEPDLLQRLQRLAGELGGRAAVVAGAAPEAPTDGSGGMAGLLAGRLRAIFDPDGLFSEEGAHG